MASSNSKKQLPLQLPSQLPAFAYFDENIYQKEINILFKGSRRYVGHELMVPEIGDYCALSGENEGRVLVRNSSEIKLLSNVCRHRQALMLQGRGHIRNIVCPLHRWTYSLEGELIGAPHFPEMPCVNLGQTKLQSWQGLLFEAEDDITCNVRKDLAPLKMEDKLNFSGYMLDHIEIHECSYNWKTFIEVYLEDYHVEPFHPGLGQFVSCGNLDWVFGEHCSVQTVGLKAALRRPGSMVYEKWHEALLNFSSGALPEYGAIWLSYFPHVMVELYPYSLIVSSIYPNGPDKTRNVIEFYYPEEIALFEREFAQAQRAAYMETCREDDEIAQLMDAGRKRLVERGVNEIGPYQSPMEDGMNHFHTWYRKEMNWPVL